MAQRVRLLFGAWGWPSGLIDVGSWVSRQGLARVRIVQICPARVFEFDHAELPDLSPGPASEELRELFHVHRRSLSCEASVEYDGEHWRVRDEADRLTYRLVPKGERVEVLVEEWLPTERLRTALVHAARKQATLRRQEWDDDELLGRVDRAVANLGSSFLEALLHFQPHAVGFRIEAGLLDLVCNWIEGVRLFTNSDILLGGPTATSHPAEVLEATGADYVFSGEAEEPLALFLELVRKRNDKGDAAQVPGLAYRYGCRIYVNTLPADGYGRTAADEAKGTAKWAGLANKQRPFAGAKIVRANRLDYSLLHGFHDPLDSLYFTGGRGCPASCAFCANLHGTVVRVKSAEQLLEEIEQVHELVASGKLPVRAWPLFQYIDDSDLKYLKVSWAAIFDEDFFLAKRRAIKFFELWSQSPLRRNYRLSIQTNPRSMLGSNGEPDETLIKWIADLKIMVQLGVESFNQDLLLRWRKPHTLTQLEKVLDVLDSTAVDYTVFQILTDYDSTVPEFVETLCSLARAAARHRLMRVASTAYVIPLYDTAIREQLEFAGRIPTHMSQGYTGYECPHPEWLDPLVAELAELADAELRFALELSHRNAAIIAALEKVEQRLRDESKVSGSDSQTLIILADAVRDTLLDFRSATFGAGL